MLHITESNRYQFLAELINLIPNTTYFVISAFEDCSGNLILDMNSYKVRTAPNVFSNDSVTFVVGGNMEWNYRGIMFTKSAVTTFQPYFAVLGGNIAFANAMPSCFERWDKWFRHWLKFSRDPNGYDLPIVAVIGASEGGGWMQPSSNAFYFNTFFPQKLGVQAVAPKDRAHYHYHVFGSHTALLVLDSGIVDPIAGAQTLWLNKTLNMLRSNYTSVFVAYHGAIYPSVTSSVLQDISREMNQNWVPLFDAYQVDFVFEHHYKGFKRTHCLKNNSVCGNTGSSFNTLKDCKFGTIKELYSVSWRWVMGY